MNGRGRWGVKINTPAIISGNDTDAQAFITAAGITNSTQQSAINTLVTNLKGYGIWTKMKAIYPMVGGTANSHKFNLKHPEDATYAFRLTFYGGWTHTSTGAKPNGSNADAITYLNALTTLTNNNYHLSHYSRTQKTTGSEIDLVVRQSATAKMIAIDQYYAGAGKAFVAGDYNTSLILNSDTNTLGMVVGSRTSQTSAKLFMNAVQKGSTLTLSNPNELPNNFFFLGGNGIANEYSSKECAFASIGDGLTDTEAANLYTAVQAYQTTLGRQVDADAQAFITAAGITDTTQQSAVSTLVTSLKGYGIWSKMKAIYPFVGGTANSHKFNLKNPADSNAAFRLGFYGGMTHNSNGVSFGGANGGASTYFNPFLTQAKNNLHLSVYTRTRPTRIVNTNDIQPNRSYIVAGWTTLRATSTTANLAEFFGTSDTATGVAALNGTTVGFSLGSRTSSTAIKYYKNTTSASGNGESHTADFVNGELTLNGNLWCYYSAANYAFASLGDGLTDSEAANFYTIVQAYQTTLGRQV
jgi:hypothetical protein